MKLVPLPEYTCEKDPVAVRTGGLPSPGVQMNSRIAVPTGECAAAKYVTRVLPAVLRRDATRRETTGLGWTVTLTEAVPVRPPAVAVTVIT